MRTRQELELLKGQARTLRREGKSLREIKQILGPMSNVTLHDALCGVPPPDWTRRPNAKDELRAKARELRAQGLDYEEIATALGVAKGSVSPRDRCRYGSVTCPGRPDSATPNAGSG